MIILDLDKLSIFQSLTKDNAVHYNFLETGIDIDI